MKEKRPSKRGPFPPFFNLVLVLSFFCILTTAGMVRAMEIFSLENGLKYIFEKRQGTGVVAVQVWVKTGSQYEQRKIAGITHFIEHLIFKGTEKMRPGEMASRIEALGGSINAFTSYDNTVYYIVIPGKGFEEGMDLLLDAVNNPAFPEAEVEKERKVVLEEIKMGEDDPQRKLFKDLFSASYEGQPYGRPIIGYAETVGSISRQDILAYFTTHYTPDNMTVVVTGDFDEQAARSLIKKHMSAKKTKRQVAREETEKKQGSGKTKTIEMDVRETYFAFSCPIPQKVHEDIPALEILANILGDGESSRLQEELRRRKALVTNIGTYIFAPRDPGLFVIYATFKEKAPEEVMVAIEEQLKRVQREGVSAWEMEKARNMIKASYVYSAETVQGKAMQVGNFQTLTGDAYYLDKYLIALDSVKPGDINRVLERYIVGKEMSIVVLKPKSSSNPHTYQLKNGLKYVVNKNQASPSFAFRIGFPGGLKEEPDGKNGIFNLLSKMLLRGTKDKDAGAIAREIDLLAGDISPFSGRNIFGLSGKFLAKDLKAVLGLLHQLLTDTFMRQDELEKIKAEVLSEIRQRDDDPTGFTFRCFNEVLYEGHPYGKDPIGKERDVEGAALVDLERFYKEYVGPSNAVFAISGDVDEKALTALIEGLFSGWKGKTPPLRKETAQASRKSVAVDRDMLQTHIVFGFSGPGLLDKDRYAVEVMDAILSGMGGRIHKVLREDNPYAYALTFFNQMAYETGGMGIYIGTGRKLTEEVERIVKTEIEKILRDGFTQKEVDDGKGYLTGNHYISMQSNSAITTAMCLDTIYGLKPNYFKVWPGLIEKVTKEDVDRVARKYLTLDRMVQVMIGKTE
ncbi:MAG TPA: pitrilysin family protein [Syntrophorhabdaceae bacterium]|nr:pitrilysin family protein [Syntrophorhabdaceae bacterium]HQM82134.1 pitrilysin family protein [Syntrophorhabdaceae bacterium]